MTRIKLASRRFVFRLWASLLFASTSVVNGMDTELDFREIEAYLQGPVRVALKNGNSQNGSISSWDGQNLRLDVALDAGSASMTFGSDEIRSIRFPGDAYLDLLREMEGQNKNIEETLRLFQAFYRQRGPYLEFLDTNQLGLFIRYVRFALENEQPLRAVAIIEVLKPHLNDAALTATLDEAALLGFFLGGMQDEASEQARRWIDNAKIVGPSALGWRILAEIHFANEQYEEALWTALYPIAFGNQMPTTHLDICYAFAIAAADETRQPEIASRLFDEMQGLDMEWPIEVSLIRQYEPKPQATPETIEIDTPSPIIDEASEPIQTPSPVDPVDSLPTRISTVSKSEDYFNQANTHETE